MKIDFLRTGGFAGMNLATSVDLDTLPVEEADVLQKLVDESDFFHIPEPSKIPGRTDGFQYTITIQREGENRSLQIGESTIPEGLLPLLNNLALRARSRKS
jgi:hypothetical protein